MSTRYTVTLTADWGTSRTLWGIPAVFEPGVSQTLPLSPDQVKGLRAARGFTIEPETTAAPQDPETTTPTPAETRPRKEKHQ